MLFTFVILLSAVTLKCLKSFDLVDYKLSLSRGLIYRHLVLGTRLMANSFYFCEKKLPCYKCRVYSRVYNIK